MISVIVPIYKVEDYLEECITSILGQTFTDIEVILVDDGSPDKCPGVCDMYALKDDRVTVIHKQNGGLSSARNAGIEIAKGDWFVFIDSDDYIDLDMLSRMVEIQRKENADIVVCDFLPFKDGEALKSKHNSGLIELYSPEEAIEAMFANKGIGWGAWNKLYNKHLFDSIRYPEGLLCEDKATTYKLYMEANKVAYIKENLYYYRLRNTSIMGNKSRQLYVDTLRINEELCDVFKKKNNWLYKCACGYAAKSAFIYVCELTFKSELADIKELYENQLRKYYVYVKDVSFLSTVQKKIIYVTGRLTEKNNRSFIKSMICCMVSQLLRRKGQ